jgi:hypothetical protein
VTGDAQLLSLQLLPPAKALDFAREKIEPAHDEKELTQSVASQAVHIHDSLMLHLLEVHMVDNTISK